MKIKRSKLTKIFHFQYKACHVTPDCDEWSFCYNGYCLNKGKLYENISVGNFKIDVGLFDL